MIYLDNAATTKVFPCAISAADEAMSEGFFNPNATYKAGVEAKKRIENCRQKLAQLCGARAEELIFTSGATESNNWVFSAVKNRKGNIVISGGEHSSVFNPAMQLKNRGIEVRIAKLDKDGSVDVDDLLGKVDDNTLLLSVIHASNETGVINPIKDIAALVRRKNQRTLIHSDGVQAFLKTGDFLDGLGVDFYSVSAHKLGAPKGIGLLYKRSGVNLSPMIFGGGQEADMRSGTQNTPFIAAFAAAAEHFSSVYDCGTIKALHDELSDFFLKNDCKIVGGGLNSGFILCVCIPKVKAEVLQNAVYEDGVIIGKGAACSGSKRGNRVLEAMGLGAGEVECCIRLSAFVDTAREDALSAAKIIIERADAIRSNHVR